MVIGFDGSRAFVDKKTGTENYSYQLLLNISKLDQINQYLVFLRPNTKVNPKDWPSNFQFEVLNFPRFWTQIGLSLATFTHKLDLLFVPSHTLPLLRRPGLKTILTVHDLGAEYLPKAHQFKQRLYLKFMTNYQLSSATRLISVSEATKKDLVEKVGIPQAKIKVIYEGFNDALFQADNSNKKARDYFLFVGTIQPRKNLERLIEAYAKFLAGDGKRGAPETARREVVTTEDISGAVSRQDPPKTTLVLAGSKGWLSESIYQLPQKLGIQDSVKFLGYVPDRELPGLYSGAKAFLFPSLFEGFGLPILEAMSSRVPVLTSNTSSMPEVAGKAAILVDPYSTESIYQGILKISDPKVAQDLVNKGIDQVKKFSWEKCAEQTLELFQVNSK